jgi:hypothetical protein
MPRASKGSDVNVVLLLLLPAILLPMLEMVQLSFGVGSWL